MSDDEAEKLSVLLLQIMATLDQSAAFVRDKDDQTSWEAYRRRLGHVMAAVSLDLAEPLWMRFPALRPRQLGGTYAVDERIYQSRFYDPLPQPMQK